MWMKRGVGGGPERDILGGRDLWNKKNEMTDREL